MENLFKINTDLALQIYSLLSKELGSSFTDKFASKASFVIFLNNSLQEKFIREIVREVIDEESKGLWHNIRAQRARGEKPARKGSKEFKAAVKAGKEILKKQKKS